jgi:predicted ATP-grasp superfamily ATP-dependent carboligase
MGPAFDPDRVTTDDLMATLVPYLETRHGVSHIEMLHNALDATAMRRHGYTGRPVVTYCAPLFPGDEDRAFQAMKGNARQNIRRAERLGLVVAEDGGAAFTDEHFAQLSEVYVRGGYAIPFGRRRVAECLEHLQASGHLLALAVYLPERRARIATGTFLINGRELLLWMWAHRAHYRWYRPTELMTWTAMQRAMEAGCTSFDLNGRGAFKAKFGAEPDESKVRWIRSRPRWLGHVRTAAETGYRVQQAVRGRLAALGRRAVEKRRDRAAACVLGDIDLVHALGLAGTSSVVVAPPGMPARHSRWTREHLAWTDAWDRPEQLVDSLVAFAAHEPEPPVLFYQEDRSLLLVSRYRERLEQFFRFVIPDAQLVEQLVDKSRFHALASRLGLPTPPTVTLRPGDPLPAELGLDGPLILKPLTRRPERWEPVAGAGRKALRIDTREALAALWPRLDAAGIPVLAQRLVPGPETCVESYHVYVDGRGRIVAGFTGRKIRTWPQEFGDSSALEITDAADVAALGADVVKRLRLRGVAKLDFKRGPDGRLHLLEVNPRFTLWHHPGARAGVNIPAIVWADLVNLPRPPIGPVRAGVRWCKAWTDRHAARAQGIPATRWAGFLLGCEARRGFAWSDPLPAVTAALVRRLGLRSEGRSPLDHHLSAGQLHPAAPRRPGG